MSRLFKIIHRRCCERFHEGAVFFLSNYEGCAYLPMDERYVFVTAHDLNNNDVHLVSRP